MPASTRCSAPGVVTRSRALSSTRRPAGCVASAEEGLALLTQAEPTTWPQQGRSTSDGRPSARPAMLPQVNEISSGTWSTRSTGIQPATKLVEAFADSDLRLLAMAGRVLPEAASCRSPPRSHADRQP